MNGLRIKRIKVKAYREGLEQGYVDGFCEGIDQGYEEGFDDGIRQTDNESIYK